MSIERFAWPSTGKLQIEAERRSLRDIAATARGTSAPDPGHGSRPRPRGGLFSRWLTLVVDSQGMVKLILNDQHLDSVLREVLENCRHRLFIATADVKELHVPGGVGAAPPRRSARDMPAPLRGGGMAPKRRGSGTPAPHTRTRLRRDSAQSIVDVFEELGERGIEIRLLHSGVPSGPFLGRLKKGVPDGLIMRRCPRTHIKALVSDGKCMYLGSANLTGAGLGAKSARRRNFEGGIWTDEVSLIDSVVDMLEEIWSGQCCTGCGRKDYCPVPLEEPEL